MLQFLFTQPPDTHCLFFQLYPPNSQAHTQLLDECRNQHIRLFTVTAVQKGIALPLPMAQPLLNLINQKHSTTYTFTELSIRLQKDTPLEDIEARIQELNTLRQELRYAATTQPLVDTVAKLKQALVWFEFRSLPLLYEAVDEHYDFGMPSLTQAILW